MDPTLPADSKCPLCGVPLPVDAVNGCCPRCLMVGAMQPTQGGETAPAIPALTPEELAPHFPQLEILECLGRGGMGVVYKARQKSLNRLVALKLLAPERADDPQFAARFEKEAHALAALNHPNIVGVHDFGSVAQSSGLPSDQPRGLNHIYYLLMEFVDGVNLRQLLQTKRLTPKEALSIVPPVCDALQCAHDHGIVHRDIKPENLLIDKGGAVKIADFGIAKMYSSPLAPREEPSAVANSTVARTSDAAPSSESPQLISRSERVTLGTPDYAAPEQQNGTADHRADIYSLGVVLYEMLTGERPKEDITPPSKRVQVDIRIDEIVLRALERTPELRFATATEFRTQVEAAANNEKPPVGTAISTQSYMPIPWQKIVVTGCVLVSAGVLYVLYSILIEQKSLPAPAAMLPAPNTTVRDSIPLADGFDFPVGTPDAQGYKITRGLFSNSGLDSMHRGEDWSGTGSSSSDLGDPVYAVADGVVVHSANTKPGHGNVIIVQHVYLERDGSRAICESSYHHLQERLVKEGQIVRRRQKIGTMGNADGLYPVHLHFELRKTPGIRLDNSKFEETTENYWWPSQFIREHRPAKKQPMKNPPLPLHSTK